MTRKRKKIYDCVFEAGSPLSAAQIHRETGEEMDLTTVYRGLQYLEDQRFITSFVYSCEERGIERYYTRIQTGHTHFMHCRKCHSFFPMPFCPIKDNAKWKKEINGFLVEDHSITLTGLCSSCQ